MTKHRNKSIIHAKQCILKPDLTDDGCSGLENFTSANRKYLNRDRQLLLMMEQVHHRINYYKIERKIAVLTQTHLTHLLLYQMVHMSSQTIQTPFFVALLHFSKPIKKSGGLDWCLDSSNAMIMNGHKNPVCPVWQ